MTKCENCHARLDPADAITNRRGTFCSATCDETNRRELWSLPDQEDEAAVPVFSDEADIPEVGHIDTTAFAHP